MSTLRKIIPSSIIINDNQYGVATQGVVEGDKEKTLVVLSAEEYMKATGKEFPSSTKKPKVYQSFH